MQSTAQDQHQDVSFVKLAQDNTICAGEAMVVAQATALLLWDVSLLGLSYVASYIGPAHSLARILWLRSDVGLFVELLVFGSIATAVPCVVLLRTLCPHGAAGKSIVTSIQARLLNLCK